MPAWRADPGRYRVAGPFGGRSYDLISVDEGVGKLRAAREAREDAAMAIIGRTHARVQSLEDVIQRTRAYQEAGADALCLVGVKDIAHLESIADGLRVPLMLVIYGTRSCRTVSVLPSWAYASWSMAMLLTSPPSRRPMMLCASSGGLIRAMA